MEYYIAENGRPAGPFALPELLQHGLTLNSQVWNETMSGWQRASEVPEVAAFLAEVSAQQQGAPASSSSGYAPPAADTYGGLDPNHPENAYAPTGYNVETGELVPPTSEQQPAPPVQPQYGQPMQPGMGQPVQPQYGQPMQPGMGQPVQPQYGQPAYGQQTYNPHLQYGQTEIVQMPKDWKTENILATIVSALCCCNVISLITGIIGIVHSNSVLSLYNSRQYNTANQEAGKAKTFFFATIIIWIVGMIISAVFAFIVMNKPDSNFLEDEPEVLYEDYRDIPDDDDTTINDFEQPDTDEDAPDEGATMRKRGIEDAP